MTVCTFCGNGLAPSARTTYRRVQGWEKPRAAGGANQITLRETLNEFACSTCIDNLRAGRDPAQAGFFAYGDE